MNRDPRLLLTVLHRATARYLRVGPKGLHLHSTPTPSAMARVLDWRSARTLYEHRRPACRSLDGTHSVSHPGRHCAACPMASRCTGQVRVDILIEGRPWRLLLALTSARNFLVHEATLRSEGRDITAVPHRLQVVDRGTFGELLFSEAP